MAYSFVSQSGQSVVVPDSLIQVQVQNSPSGIVAAGILALVGEASSGPSWSEDAANGLSISNQPYGPGDLQQVIAKYGSGNLVDGFRGAITASNSTQIQGAPATIYLVKTNNSVQASLALPDGSGTLTAVQGGAVGNSIQASIAVSQLESAPSTNSFSYVPSSSSSALALRVNGGAAQTLAISANESPTSLAAALSSLNNINAVGGVSRNILASLSGTNISLSVVSGQSVQITLASPAVYASAPQVGDTLNIPSGSVLEGGSSQNVGWYVVTAASNISGSAVITALKITSGAPSAVAATPISGTPSNDLVDYSYMSINNMSGSNRNVLASDIGQNITMSALGSSLTATLASGQRFSGMTQLNDIVYIPDTSAFVGAGDANVGWYQVTAYQNLTSSAYITMLRLSNGNPVSVASTPIAAASDIEVYNPQIPGAGKALEIYDNGGSVNISTIMLGLGVSTPATWLSQLLISSAELEETVLLKQQSNNISFSQVVGGNVALEVGYDGTSATLTISNGILTTSVVGGSGANLNINLALVSSIANLVTMINASTGYSASAGSTADGLKNPSVLDESTYSIASSLGNEPGRIKEDLSDFEAVFANSTLVSYVSNVHAGLPQPFIYSFLSGGQNGGTSGLEVANAINALMGVNCNFVVPLFSQNASVDIAEGNTDPSSTYMIEAINVAVSEHCNAMSTPIVKKNRIGCLSIRDTFINDQNAALNIANYRCVMLFQDVIDLNSFGNLQQYQPWMASCKAAGMQAAGGYKSIFNKTVQVSGILQAAGDFNDQNYQDLTSAIEAGLIPMEFDTSGNGFIFTTDQTTYGVDNNVVYNSMQAVYSADRIAVDLAASLKAAFVGQSVADVTQGTATDFISKKMAQYLALKLIVASPAQKAPAGWQYRDRLPP